MVDNRFHHSAPPLSINSIAVHIGCTTDTTKGDLLISSIRALDEAQSGDLSFLSNIKYLPLYQATGASACIVPASITEDMNPNVILLKSHNPYLAYAKAINLFYKSGKTYGNKRMPSAYISSSATIGKNCYIGHNVVIEDKVIIGDDCIIEAGSFLDYGVIIGNRAIIYANVAISNTIIGNDVVILPGAKIGQDGFGFATDKGQHHKIYHTGRVIIGDDVEIGANTTIDRGSLNDTVIEDSCRIDNLVQIGHNVKIGKGSIIVSQVGIAGSTSIGSYCAIGGQVGISGHLTIGNQAQIVAKSGVMRNVGDGEIIAGIPAIAVKDWHRQTVTLKKLINK